MNKFTTKRSRYVYLPLFGFLVLTLTACGGSGDSNGPSRNINQQGINQPAPLDSPEDAARATVAFGSIVIPVAGLATALAAIPV